MFEFKSNHVLIRSQQLVIIMKFPSSRRFHIMQRLHLFSMFATFVWDLNPLVPSHPTYFSYKIPIWHAPLFVFTMNPIFTNVYVSQIETARVHHSSIMLYIKPNSNSWHRHHFDLAIISEIIRFPDSSNNLIVSHPIRSQRYYQVSTI